MIKPYHGNSSAATNRNELGQIERKALRDAKAAMATAVAAIERAAAVLNHAGRLHELPYSVHITGMFQARAIEYAQAFATELVKFYAASGIERGSSFSFDVYSVNTLNFHNIWGRPNWAGVWEARDVFDRIIKNNYSLAQGFHAMTKPGEGGLKVEVANVDVSAPFPSWFVSMIDADKMRNLMLAHNATVAVSEATVTARARMAP